MTQPQPQQHASRGPSRRGWLQSTTATGIAAVIGTCLSSLPISAGLYAAEAAAAGPQPRSSREPFGYCLNTATIRGQKVPLSQAVELAAAAGYHAIEPWIDEIDAHQKSGGSLSDLRKKISDLGLTVESAIGFANWISDDDAERAKGLENARRDMDMLKQIGGVRIAAPPIGAHDKTGPTLLLPAIAQRYRTLLDIGVDLGVIPQLEVWGFSRTLSRLSETMFVATEAGHPASCVLPDIYHLYKGGSGFEGLKLLAGTAVHVFHVNDYPNTPGREQISDEHRVYPGDGVAPQTEILRTLNANGFRGYLSLELFNRDYWKLAPGDVAKTGVQKIRETVLAAELNVGPAK